MADNVEVTAGSGTTLSTDEVGGAHVQRVRSTWEQVRVAQTPTITAGTAYAAKDAVGGLLTFAGAARYTAGSGRVVGVTIVDRDQERADLDLILFDQTITAPTNDAAFDPTDTELTYVVGWVPVSAGAYADFNDNSVAYVPADVPYVLVGGTSLFGVLVARGTPTYTATGDLTVILTMAVD